MSLQPAHGQDLTRENGKGDKLLGIEDGKRQVEHEGQPVAVDEEEQREEAVYGGLGDYVRIESVAEVNGVDVVTVADG
jgi:hypothetical protein